MRVLFFTISTLSKVFLQVLRADERRSLDPIYLRDIDVKSFTLRIALNIFLEHREAIARVVFGRLRVVLLTRVVPLEALGHYFGHQDRLVDHVLLPIVIHEAVAEQEQTPLLVEKVVLASCRDRRHRLHYFILGNHRGNL